MSAEKYAADWQSHHIEGYAHAAIEAGRDGYFNAPLISHIEGNLYVGGCINGVRLDEDFAHVVSLYKWERYTLGGNTRRIEVEMYDASDVPAAEQIDWIAEHVVKSLAEGKTLVHCQAGLNRSNLIAAAALVKMGRTPAEAIALLRERRSPVVLCNRAFEAWLLGGDQS
jgi:protein-tyrosine phosphatase